MTRILVCLLAVQLVACGKKKAPEPAAKDDGGVTADTRIPDGAATRAFADHVIRNPIVGLKPSDGGGAEIVWNKVSFGPKNRFKADAALKADGETIDCEENGDWSMDTAAESAEKGIVELTIDKSSCPGRPGSGKLRLLLQTGKGSNYTIVFR